MSPKDNNRGIELPVSNLIGIGIQVDTTSIGAEPRLSVELKIYEF
jgi:hypothetical protein